MNTEMKLFANIIYNIKKTKTPYLGHIIWNSRTKLLKYLLKVKYRAKERENSQIRLYWKTALKDEKEIKLNKYSKIMNSWILGLFGIYI